MHTVELLPGDELAEGVRGLWDLLLSAGLPSLATHRHPTNRPHLTLLTGGSLAGLPPLPLPIPCSLGEVRMLGRALIRTVTPTEELRSLQEAAFSASAGAWPPPEQWVPHLSLALRVPADRQREALELLASVPPVTGSFVAARTYDTETRTVRSLQAG